MRIMKVFTIACTCLLLTSCTAKQAPVVDTDDTMEPTTPQEISIGMITPLSGGASSYGQDAVNVATMIIDEVNALGGIN